VGRAEAEPGAAPAPAARFVSGTSSIPCAAGQVSSAVTLAVILQCQAVFGIPSNDHFLGAGGRRLGSTLARVGHIDRCRERQLGNLHRTDTPPQVSATWLGLHIKDRRVPAQSPRWDGKKKARPRPGSPRPRSGARASPAARHHLCLAAPTIRDRRPFGRASKRLQTASSRAGYGS
jgi:hypothetical protein